MPLLLEKDGYQFYFKKGEPLILYKKPHVHVRGHGGTVEFFIEVEKVKIKKDNKTMTPNKIFQAREITQANKDKFLEI